MDKFHGVLVLIILGLLTNIANASKLNIQNVYP